MMSISLQVFLLLCHRFSELGGIRVAKLATEEKKRRTDGSRGGEGDSVAPSAPLLFHLEPSLGHVCEHGLILSASACQQVAVQLEARWKSRPFARFTSFKRFDRPSACNVRVDSFGWRVYYNRNLQSRQLHHMTMRACSDLWQEQADFFELSSPRGACERDVSKLNQNMCLTAAMQVLSSKGKTGWGTFRFFARPGFGDVSIAPHGCSIRSGRDWSIFFNTGSGPRTTEFSQVCGQHPWGVASHQAALAQEMQLASAATAENASDAASCDALAYAVCCPGCGDATCTNRRRFGSRRTRRACHWFVDTACCGSSFSCKACGPERRRRERRRRTRRWR